MDSTELIKNPAESLIEALEVKNMITWEWEQFTSMGMQCRAVKDISQWALGRLALGVETKFGESSLKEYAKEIGVNHNSLNTYRWVAKKYPSWAPEQNHLPHYCYQIAAGTDEPEEWINKAADNDWTSTQLQIEIKKAKDPSFELSKPSRPKKGVECPSCGFHFEIEV